jgi:hypothetical protein
MVCERCGGVMKVIKRGRWGMFCPRCNPDVAEKLLRETMGAPIK